VNIHFLSYTRSVSCSQGHDTSAPLPPPSTRDDRSDGPAAEALRTEPPSPFPTAAALVGFCRCTGDAVRNRLESADRAAELMPFAFVLGHRINAGAGGPRKPNGASEGGERIERVTSADRTSARSWSGLGPLTPLFLCP
jgi:hypothetical protein